MIAWLLVPLALAEEPVGVDAAGGEVVSVRKLETDVYRFDVPACDRVKAVFRDDRPADAPRTKAFAVTLHNQGSRMCLYKGLVLRGTIAGAYTSSQRNPEGTGFFLPPRGELSFLITPDDPKAPRVAIELQIPPGSGAIILNGLGPDDPIPEPTSP